MFIACTWHVCACACVCVCVVVFICVRTHQDLLEPTFEVFNWFFSLYAGVTWLVNIYDMTRYYLWYDSFNSVLWCVSLVLFPVRCFDLTYSYVWRDSFRFMTWCSAVTCVTWLYLYVLFDSYLYVSRTWLFSHAWFSSLFSTRVPRDAFICVHVRWPIHMYNWPIHVCR